MSPIDEARFWEKVIPEPNSGCWLWIAATITNGYGVFGNSRTNGYGIFGNGRSRLVHRISYLLSGRVIPSGKQLDHKCRVRICVNPDHLEPVTNKENALRGQGFAAKNAAMTTCIRGHALSGGNLYIRANGHRQCRICQSDNVARWKARHAD